MNDWYLLDRYLYIPIYILFYFVIFIFRILGITDLGYLV